MERERTQDLPRDREELMDRWPRLAGELLEEIHSPADAGQLVEQLEQNESFITLVKGWDYMPSASQAIAWEKIQERIWEAALATRPYCVRCGECCRRGSPSLYDQDRPALFQSKIELKNMMTLRVGEVAYSNRDRKIVKLARERIKLKEAPGGNTCVFLGPGGDACLIYPDRPFQCRIMECWDPSRFDKLGNLKPLTRLDLLGVEGPVAELIQNHEGKCSVESLARELSGAEDKDPATQAKAIDMILYDIHMREFAHEKLELPKDEMDFFFGRPLLEICHSFGWDVQPDRKGEPRLKKLPRSLPPEV